MKSFKIGVSIVLGVGLLLGVVFVISLNNKVKKLDLLYREQKTTMEERVPVKTDDSESNTQFASSDPRPIESSYSSQQKDQLETESKNQQKSYVVREKIVNELRQIDISTIFNSRARSKKNCQSVYS